MIVGAVSDVGLKRQNNQDYMFASTEKDFPLFIIADGMGGHNAGEVASSMAVKTILDKFRGNLEKLNNEKTIKLLIKEAIQEANDNIYLKSFERQELNGMGTTITMAYVYDTKIFIGHVGDSRAYVVKNRELSQITEDHSLVNELVKNGSITPAEAINHPQRNMITRAVGTSYKINLDLYIINYEDKDKLVLCSDGLTNMVDDNTILEVINSNEVDMYKVCNDLVSLAKNNGGRDNITVVGINLEKEVLK